MCTDACAHSNQGVGSEEGVTGTHIWGHTCLCYNYAKGLKQRLGVMWT